MAVAMPPIVHDPIPFGAQRIAETRAYAVRHYGLHRARLIAPKVIVEHMTENSSFGATFNTFAPTRPTPSCTSGPATCAHFVIDPAGTIHQLVSLKWICRHTVGLNYTAIGIEHVGFSESGVLNNIKMIRASLRLTRVAAGQVRDRHQERDRPRRVAEQSVPPRGRRAAEDPDARRLAARRSW